MAAEEKINKVTKLRVQRQLKKMWHPTKKWCYFVAFVLKEALPREQGIVPHILQIMREMLPSSKLTVLDLINNEITDAWAKKLAEMLPSSKLRRLYLSINQITDAGAIKLAEMLPSSFVTRFVLRWRPATSMSSPT